MSRNARIEEVSDSDPEDMDVALFDPRAAAAAAAPPPYAASTHTPDRAFPTNRTLLSRSNLPTGAPPASSSDPSTQYVNAGDASAYKSYNCLYPVYFDVSRSRSSGRRVSKSLAVANPLARGLVDACAFLQLKTVFEPGKTHPHDWANPGRVRILMKPDGVVGVMKNKFVLYRAVAEFLRLHPTTREAPLKLRLPNMPWDGKIPEPPAVPRGWNIGSVLPLHSAALSGGGVSDDIFKEMMRDMGVPGMEAGPSAEQQVVKKEKKEKKKGKR